MDGDWVRRRRNLDARQMTGVLEHCAVRMTDRPRFLRSLCSSVEEAGKMGGDMATQSSQEGWGGKAWVASILMEASTEVGVDALQRKELRPRFL